MMSYSPNGVDPNSNHQALSEDAASVFCRGSLRLAMSAALRYGLALISVSVAFGLVQTFLYYHLTQPFTAFALSAIAFLVFALAMTLVMRGRNELEVRVTERIADLTKANEELTREIARHKGTEGELRAVVDNAPVFLWSDLPDGYCDFLNQRWLSYFNLSLQEAQGAGWATVLHPDDAAHHMESWQKSVATGAPLETEARFRRFDGEYRWFLNRAYPLRDKTGRIVKWYGTNIDIENLKQSESRLRQSEANLAEAQRLSHTGSWALNPATNKILYWSEECYRIWGFDPVQGPPYRASVFNRVHPDDRDRMYEETQEALREKRDYTIEFRIVLPDGTVKYLETTGHHVFSARGELVKAIGTNVDVTERKRAEKALRESETKIRRLVDANIIGIFIWDFDGRILEANEALLHILGYDHEDLVAGLIRWTDLTPPEWRDRDTRLIQKHKQTGFLQPFEKEYFRKDGSRVPVLIGVATFEDGGNQGVAFVLDLTEQKRAEQAAQQLVSIVESSDDAIVSKDLDGIIRTWNRGAERLLGYKATEVIGRPITILIPPDRFDEEPGILARIRRGEPVEHYETVRRHKDGRLIDISLTVSPLRDAKGAIVGASKIARDITGRKRAEQALRDSEAKFRGYAETASDWFWEIGPDFKFTLLTENAFGSHASDRIGTACWDHALDLETEPEKWRLIWENLDSRKPFRDFVYCTLGGNGSPMYVRVSGKPVFDGSGEFLGYRGTGTDVTALMRAQEEQRRSSAWLAQAQRLSRTGNWVYDASTNRYLYWSDEAYRIWGLDPLQGLPSREDMWQRIHPDDRDRVLEEVQESLREKRDFAAAFRIVLPDGTIRYLEATTRHKFSSLGELGEAISSSVDVTERKRAQEEHERLRQLESDLAHMNRLSMMGEMTASLAHEITQPIASARNNARAAVNFLDKQPPDLGEVREALDCVVGDADRAGDIVDRIRDQAKKAPARKHRFDLNEAINEVIELAQSAISENGISVQTRLNEALRPVAGDRVQLQQVVLNLILNAVEAMSSVEVGRRELLISTEQNQTGDALAAVHDSGPGIDPERLEDVFEAYYTTKSGGVGLGLSICRSIIEGHGGRLWAEANEPRGAVFQFTFPSAEIELMNSLQTAHPTREPCEGTVSDYSHQQAYEGNKQPHRSGRESDQRHWGMQ
jgi:PAS domain S-box-containing protein